MQFLNIANLTSLRNVAFHWLTSGCMQLASSIMQLAAPGHRRNILGCNCLFDEQMLVVH